MLPTGGKLKPVRCGAKWNISWMEKKLNEYVRTITEKEQDL